MIIISWSVLSIGTSGSNRLNTWAEFRNVAGAAGSARTKFSGHLRKILGSERAALEKNLEKVQFFIIRAKF